MTVKRETEWERRKRRDRERAEHVAEHGPGCQICGAVPKRGGLHQDHDHKTGRTRGWLCHRCNRIMWPGVTAEWLVRAARYVDPDRHDLQARSLAADYAMGSARRAVDYPAAREHERAPA